MTRLYGQIVTSRMLKDLGWVEDFFGTTALSIG